MLANYAFALSTLATLAPVTRAVDYSTLDYHGLYFRQEWTNQPIAVQRLDPILQPGVVSSHLHSFIGTNAIAPTMDFAQTQTATCSQVYVKPDKSSYWMPSLFFQSPSNSSFIRVPESHRVLYYFNRASNATTGESDPSIIEEFPEGFRMIAGNAMLRSPAATKQLQNAVEWFCHGPDVKSSGFPGNFTSCPNGFAGSIHFPYCWNGDDFDSSDPTVHMSYPKTDAEGNGAADTGACPDSHLHVLPHIFIEFWFDVSSFDGLYEMGDTPWVLSQGDPTGYGFHADFLSGWELGVLENAMKTCDIGESGDPLSDCFEVWTDEERDACEEAPLVDEEVDGWLDALPGCNPIQYGPEDATMKTGCGNNATLTSGTESVASSADSSAVSAVSSVVGSGAYSTSTDTSFISSDTATVTSASATVPATATYESYTSSSTAILSNSAVSLPTGWISSGCHSDAIAPHSLSGITFAYWGEDVTSSTCAKYCDSQGYRIAGTEYSGQCFCGDELTDSEELEYDECDMPCKGDSQEICGGDAALSVFIKDGTTLKGRAVEPVKNVRKNGHLRRHVAGSAVGHRSV